MRPGTQEWTQSGARWEAKNKYVKVPRLPESGRNLAANSPLRETHNGQALRGRHSAAHSPPSRERKRFYARASVPGRPTAPTEIPAAPTRSGKGRTCTAPEFKPHLFYLSPSARSLNRRFVVWSVSLLITHYLILTSLGAVTFRASYETNMGLFRQLFL